MAKSRRQKLPKLISFEEFLSRKRFPKPLPMVFIDNEQFTRWFGKQTKGLKKEKQLGALLEFTPAPEYNGYIMTITKSHLSGDCIPVTRTHPVTGQKYVECVPRKTGDRTTPILDSGCGIHISKRSLKCSGNCDPDPRTGRRKRCITTLSVVTERRVSLGCVCR